MNVARRLDEVYPGFYDTFVVLLPMFDWQEELLQEWSQSCIRRIQHQGGNWIAESLSEVEVELLSKHGIRCEVAVITIDSD